MEKKIRRLKYHGNQEKMVYQRKWSDQLLQILLIEQVTYGLRITIGFSKKEAVGDLDKHTFHGMLDKHMNGQEKMEVTKLRVLIVF